MPNVLICDDSNMARKQVMRSLPAQWQEHVTFAEHGGQAIEQLKSESFDILFLDLTMPILDGLGVLTQILMDKIEVSVIVISADIQPEMKARVEELGALTFIQKPINPQKLNDVLRCFELI